MHIQYKNKFDNVFKLLLNEEKMEQWGLRSLIATEELNNDENLSIL